MRFPKVLLGAVAVATIGGVSAAGASSTQKGGKINVWVDASGTSDTTSPITITGAIGDYGLTTSINKNGTTDPEGNYVKIVLKKGSFEVNSTTLNKTTNSAPPEMYNSSNCSFVGGGTGPVTLLDGSGAYKGITGTLTITETFVGILPRITSGKNKGQCNMANNVNPLKGSTWGSITGSGTVSFT
jgi:uncharacterized membrane protein